MSQLFAYSPEGSLTCSHFEDFFTSQGHCPKLDCHLTADGRHLICTGPHYMEPNTDTIDMKLRVICTRYGKLLAQRRIRFDAKVPKGWIMIRSCVAVDEPSFFLLYSHFSNASTLYVRKVSLDKNLEPSTEYLDIPLPTHLKFPMSYAFGQANSLIMIMRPFADESKIAKLDLTTRKIDIWPATDVVGGHTTSPTLWEGNLVCLDLEQLDKVSYIDWQSGKGFDRVIPCEKPPLSLKVLFVPGKDGWLVVGKDIKSPETASLWRLTLEPLEWKKVCSLPIEQDKKGLFPGQTNVPRPGTSNAAGDVHVSVQRDLDDPEKVQLKKRWFRNPAPLQEMCFEKLATVCPRVLQLSFEEQRKLGLPPEFCQPETLPDPEEGQDPLILGFWKDGTFSKRMTKEVKAKYRLVRFNQFQ